MQCALPCNINGMLIAMQPQPTKGLAGPFFAKIKNALFKHDHRGLQKSKFSMVQILT